MRLMNLNPARRSVKVVAEPRSACARSTTFPFSSYRPRASRAAAAAFALLPTRRSTSARFISASPCTVRASVPAARPTASRATLSASSTIPFRARSFARVPLQKIWVAMSSSRSGRLAAAPSTALHRRIGPARRRPRRGAPRASTMRRGRRSAEGCRAPHAARPRQPLGFRRGARSSRPQTSARRAGAAVRVLRRWSCFFRTSFGPRRNGRSRPRARRGRRRSWPRSCGCSQPGRAAHEQRSTASGIGVAPQESESGSPPSATLS